MQRIDLAEIEHTTERVWTCGLPGARDYAVIRIGRLDGHRWFASRAGWRWDGSWAANDERQACDACSSWMVRRGGTWTEVAVSSSAASSGVSAVQEP